MVVRPWMLGVVVLVGTGSYAAFRGVTSHRHAGTPSDHLLFNGWGISPVGDQVRIGDMPLKLIASSDGRQLIASTLGFSGVHVTTVDTATRTVIQSLDTDRVWNGLAFSPDGKTLYVGGGNGGKLTAYAYDAGHLNKKNEIKGPAYTFISGIAVKPDSGVIYVL